ncbi:MAG: hypothetical protein ABSF44_12210 [Candidatus Bathyarchaeia archaeon]
MNKKLVTLTIILVLSVSAFIAFNQNSATHAAASNPFLKIYVAPSSVLADNNVYNCIFVQFIDSSGQPFRALQDTTISLSSSLTNIGTVDPTITILKNTTYSSANFYTTLNPGTTTISASATGYSTVQASVTTVTPIPSAIAVYGFPSILPADGGTYPAIMVQLQDSSGLPERAPPDGVNVSLFCSDSNIGTVSSNVTIPYGQTYAIANFTTTPTTGSATVTTLANGYATRQMTIATRNVVFSPDNPKYLKIFAGPTEVLADSNSYPQVAVELQDSQGDIASMVNSDVLVSLISTDTNIGQINPTLTIGPGSQFLTYSIATFNTTYTAGSTNIVAAATNWTAASQSISTVEFIPPKLAVYTVPSLLPADKATYSAVIVQLQDSQGRPAKNLEGDVNVNLFSTEPQIGSINSTLTIPSGKTQATVNLTTTNAPGSTTITAQAPGYAIGQGTVTTYLIDFSPLSITLTSSAQSITSSNATQITAYVNVNGSPITGATVAFSSNDGGLFSATTEQGNGYYQTNFTAASFSQTTLCTITASASKTGAYISSQNTMQITVTPAPAATPAPTPTPTPTATPTPTPTPSSNSTTKTAATLTLRILDDNDNPLNDTLVSSITQPAGIGTLVDLTNATGYVTFQNVTAGSYTFKLVKQGYPTTNETIDFPGQSLTLDINLVNGKITTQTNGTSIMLVLIIVVAAIAIAGASGFLMIKSGERSRTRKIKELQKQLNPKT